MNDIPKELLEEIESLLKSKLDIYFGDDSHNPMPKHQFEHIVQIFSPYYVNLVKAKEALKKISEIEDQYNCGDWDEIEEARKVANDALRSIQ